MNNEFIAYMLNVLLNNLKALTHINQYVHWNVEGIHFWQLHKMLDEFYNTTFEYEDKVAEEIRKLGYLVSPLVENDDMVIDEYRYQGLWEENELLSNLIDDYNKFSELLTNTIHYLNSPKHEGLKNLLADLQTDINKHKWFIISTLRK